jgi:hypothetical protein
MMSTLSLRSPSIFSPAFVFGAFITISSLLLVAAGTGFAQTTERILRVPQDYATIQTAIDLSMPGDDIVIAPGTYVENVTIAHHGELTLVSRGATIQWSDRFAPTMLVDGVSGVNMVGLRVVGSNQNDAVKVSNADLWIEHSTLESGGVNFSALAALSRSWVHGEDLLFDGPGDDVTVVDALLGVRGRRCQD